MNSLTSVKRHERIADMTTRTIVFWDTQDSNNPGWAWRTTTPDGGSGEINEPDACEFLRCVENGYSCSVSGREALAAELRSAGVDPWTVRYVDCLGNDIGEMML